MRLVLCLLLLCVAAGTAGARDITHVWGTTRIEGTPQRIVSLSYNGADNWLALGIVPVAYRAWYGGDDLGLWPWAAGRVPPGAAMVLRGEIDAEVIARLRPDLIEAIYAGITQSDYARLSRIAPVLAPPAGAGEFGATWRDMIATFGAATDREAQALEVVAGLQGRIDAIRAAHPDWQGRTAVVAMPDGPLVLTARDSRMLLLQALGFRLPPATEALSRGSFFFRLDRELTDPLEADALIWLDLGGGVGAVIDHPLRHGMKAPREGREIVADPELSAALSYGSALSLGYALDRLVPLLEAAVDGNPATPVPGSAQAGLVP
jgi:iron complex transport system substrate-binding protein